MNESSYHPITEQTETASRQHSARQVLIIALAFATVLDGLYFVLAFRIGAWQLFAGAIDGLFLVAVLLVSFQLVSRDRPVLAVWLAMGGITVAALVANLLISGLGEVFTLGVALGLVLTALQTLRERQLRWSIIGSIGLSGAVLLMDTFGSANRMPAPPEMVTLVPFLVLAVLIIFGWWTARQFANYDLHTKMVIAFLVVSLVPTSLLVGVRGIALRQALYDGTKEALFAAARQTASSVDDLIVTNLDIVCTQAELPALVTYLGLPEDQRPGSPEEAAAKTTLGVLRRRDEENILSYALLDQQGRVMLDTVAGIGGLDDFQTTWQTEQPYVSSIECSPATSEPTLYFTSPVRDGVGEVIGLLQVRYRAAALQILVAQRNGMAGPNSFAVLFDENETYIAHGIAPQTLYKTVVASNSERTTKQDAIHCSSQFAATESFVSLPGLAQSLSNSKEEPLFTARDVATGDQLHQVAVTGLETQPWRLAFFQPLEIIVAPIEADSRTMKVLSLIVAGLVTGAGLVVAQLLAGPLSRLNETAARIAAGDLCAQASVETSDEIGRLASTFNNMTSQLRDLVGTLEQRVADRTRDLEQQTRELARSNAELQQFAYVASHDLQEPLRMVTSYVQLLERRYKGQLDADADDFIAFAVDGATRMHQLIQGLLAYSRVGTHGQPFEPTDCEIVLGQVLDNLQLAIQESGAAVTHGSLPTVMADPTQLSQLLQNLVGNAIKFRGERRPQIHIGAERESDASQGETAHWRFWVRDNGIGIDPEYAERVFLIFQRLHTRDEYPGTGIGLAICKRIVERHGGRIWVESQPGQGSTFYFTIPHGVNNEVS